MNKVIMSGWIGDNFRVVTTKTGKTKVDFDLICKRQFKNKEGKYGYDYPRVEIWLPSITQYAQRFLDKGSHIEIEGNLRTDIVKSIKEPDKKYKRVFILCTNLIAISSFKGNAANGRTPEVKDDEGEEAASADFASMGSEHNTEGIPSDVDDLDW